MAAPLRKSPIGLLSPREAAARVGSASVKTLKNWRAMRMGPDYETIGGRVYYRQSNLDQWLGRRHTESTRQYAPIRD